VEKLSHTSSNSREKAAGEPPTVREQTLLYGETRRKHLGILLFHPKSMGNEKSPYDENPKC
jgi:hypothetical protein